MASLFVIQGRDQGRRFELAVPVVALGRDQANTIQLHDAEVSRRHAEISKNDAGFALADLESSNGTFVNNQRVSGCNLKSGDRVQLGRTLMIFTDAEKDAGSQLLSEVDIITRRAESPSRIVKSLSQEEGSRIFSEHDASDSPWLARARSNL